ncbi:TetR/AcrR family transcriptional regulator [Nocardioides aurantiacus]|uniref:TetR family transcriptional regulator n=1 Tax=Nocardioides aurantiacus TaxID=86796 RepID=A0A3N2CTQ7_9ACTN|nr:TetR/AcrR family transcriptional regulator [Nocardioides aurantiacus]ROR90919.1 TetR family transcriptional regulator [Nocardioides aurantiacus]
MSRWQPNARERLADAALELFVEQGFASTTVPEITARAGLTTRTFFRHFADKREVLFDSGDSLPALARRIIAEAPPELSPIAVIAGGLDTVASEQFGGDIEHFRTRRAVIHADESLRERELRKMSALSEAISHGFRQRGLDELRATLVAHVTATVFSVAIGRWLDEDKPAPLSELLHDTLAVLRSVLDDLDASGSKAQARADSR